MAWYLFKHKGKYTFKSIINEPLVYVLVYHVVPSLESFRLKFRVFDYINDYRVVASREYYCVP
jgi:hypothetical protein